MPFDPAGEKQVDCFSASPVKVVTIYGNESQGAHMQTRLGLLARALATVQRPWRLPQAGQGVVFLVSILSMRKFRMQKSSYQEIAFNFKGLCFISRDLG